MTDLPWQLQAIYAALALLLILAISFGIWEWRKSRVQAPDAHMPQHIPYAKGTKACFGCMGGVMIKARAPGHVRDERRRLEAARGQRYQYVRCMQCGQTQLTPRHLLGY